MKVMMSIQGLMPWCGGSAISEASLCSAVGKLVDTVVTCRKGCVDYSYAKSFGLKHIHEYEPKEFFAAWREEKHWLGDLLKGVDLVHLNGHWRWEDSFLARICLKKGIPYILQPRGMLLLGHRRVFLKRAYNVALGNHFVKHAARLVALSEYEKEQFAPYHYPQDRVLVMPNGVPVLEKSDLQSRPEVERLMRTAPEYFLYLGRLESRKNLLFLVDTYSAYQKEGGSAHLVFVGPSERGYEETLRAHITSRGLDKWVHVKPPFYDEDKWSLLHHAKALIYPTLQEPFGRVPFEAVSARTFPIVPNKSGSAEYLAKLLPHCVYEEGNAKSLVAVMKTVEKFPQGERAELLKKAVEWVNTELDWQNLSKRYVSLYESVLGEQKIVRRAETA